LLESFDSLPKSPLAKNILAKYPELKPIDGLKIEWKQFLFSPVINWPRPEVVWFVEINWKREPRLFYKSNSDGGWRATTGMRWDYAYSKGKESVDNYSYVTTTKLDPVLENKLNEISKKLNISWENLPLFSIGDWYNKAPFYKEQFWKEVKSFDDWWVLDVFRKKWRPWHWRIDFKTIDKDGNERPLMLWEVKIHLKSLDDKYPDGFIPDFSKWPIKNYETHHTIAWPVKVDVFEWMLNGKKIEWHIAHSKNNPSQVWILNIRPKDSKITSFGTDSEFINSWVLTSKPFEYTSQLPISFNRQVKNWKWDYRDVIKNYYYDITDVLPILRPIREYKEKWLNKNRED